MHDKYSGLTIFHSLPKNQEEFESQYKQKARIYPYENFPSFYIDLSDCPRKIGHSIHPNGEFGDMVVSHSLKLTGFQRTLNWTIDNIILK